MSAERASSPCNKFQANVFNKSKCQNCFKSRELHLLSDQDLEQVKPVFGGWLCLAPEGTDFDNPMQRSRKWQRRFFILYEDGRLSFALDDLPSTLPQGTVNISLCVDILDAEARTGQKNALCITAAEQEIFIRADSRELLNGWNDHLTVYLRSNKQNQNKKRKVEPVATQEPSPAKMAATDSNFLPSEIPAESSCPGWQSDQRDRDLSRTPVWTVTEAPGQDQDQEQDQDRAARPSCLSSVSGDSVLGGSSGSPGGCLDVATAGSGKMPTARTTRDKRRSSSAERILGLEAGGGAAVSRKSRSETRSSRQQDLKSDAGRLSPPAPTRRARSLDRRTSDTAMTPDLLNFKKGWLVKLDGTQQWRRYWFVLSADSLRFYKDSIAEEASALEGDIDLTKCFNVCECQVQRNYGFQIHTPNAAHTLSAMTAGIRQNWIQALVKNVHPGHAPNPSSPPTLLPRPDVTQDSVTFDWDESRLQSRLWTRTSGSVETGDQERRKRREERRRRYESVLGAGQVAGGGAGALQRVEAGVEECWRLVEKTVFRGDRSVQLLRDHSEMKKLLEGCRKEVDLKAQLEDLKAQLEESERSRQELEARLNPAGCSPQQCELPPAPETREEVLRCNVQEPPSWSPHTSIVRPDTEETLQEARGPLPETESLEVLCDHPGCQELSSEPPPGSPQQDVDQLSQEVELLTRQNEALNQRNQEMLNQLTEADREIQRLKSELGSSFVETQLFFDDSGRVVEELETELRSRTQELLDAQALMASMEKRLAGPETGAARGEPAASGLKETDSGPSEVERRPKQTGETCEEVQQENPEMKAAEDRNSPSEGQLQQMIEGAVLRLKVFDSLLELMARSDAGSWTECEEQQSQLGLEEEFWRTLHNKLSSHCHQERWEEVLNQAMEQTMLLPGLRPLPETAATNVLDRGGIKQLRVATQSKISSLNCLATAMEGSAHLKLFPEDHLSGSIRAAATEAFYCCWLIWVQSSQGSPSLRGPVRELEEQLVVRGAELPEAFESVQMEKEKLKVMCERALASMEESHSKTVGELQCRHQREVERLLLERERLLEEESAATATAIKAIREAHRLELEREEQRREAGSTHLGDLHRLHSEEVRSYQRELQVLSQQFSLRCLENAHLAQALDAERRALSQCQQENQDLRTRNQELTSDLGSEVTRLCSLVNQDALPLSQDLDLFHLEITLRVKESEVHCLKQEITTLKDRLQMAGQDKVNTMKKYKEVLSELNLLRVKTERETDELRENLRLARDALQEISSS